jgi:hypothetical protein
MRKAELVSAVLGQQQLMVPGGAFSGSGGTSASLLLDMELREQQLVRVWATRTCSAAHTCRACEQTRPHAGVLTRCTPCHAGRQHACQQ